MYWIWGIEAVLVVMVATFASFVTDAPFSEKKKTWSKTDWEGELSASAGDAPDAEQVEQRMDQDGVDWLIALAGPDAPGAQNRPSTRLQRKCISVPKDAECSGAALVIELLS